MASSVYAKTGVLYDSYKRYFGAAGPPDILVAHASSRDSILRFRKPRST